MDLAQLETFIAIVEERGFSRAAIRLHRTQPGRLAIHPPS